MAESDTKRRPFRSLGLRLRSFGRNVFRTYSPAPSNPESSTDSPRPTWQQNTEIPLLWQEQSNDNVSPQQPYTEVFPAPEQQVQRRTITPQRRSPQLPQQNQPRQQQQPQQSQQPQRQVQRNPAQESDDEKLYRIMAFHRDRQAKSDQIKADIQTKTQKGESSAPRRRPTFDYVDTRSLGGEDTPQVPQDDNAPDDWDLPSIDNEADEETVQMSRADDAPQAQSAQPDISAPPNNVVQRQADDTIEDSFIDDMGDDGDFLAPEPDYDEDAPQTFEQPSSSSGETVQPSRMIQRTPIAEPSDYGDDYSDEESTYTEDSVSEVDHQDVTPTTPVTRTPSTQQPAQAHVQRDIDTYDAVGESEYDDYSENDDFGYDDAQDDNYQAVDVPASDVAPNVAPNISRVQRHPADDNDNFVDSGEVETGFNDYAENDEPAYDNQPSKEADTAPPVQLQRQSDEQADYDDYDEPDNNYVDDGGYDAPVDAPAQASVQREVYDDYDEPDEGGYDAPVDAPAQASVQREVYDDYDEPDDGGYDAPVDAPAQASVQREVYDDYDESDEDYGTYDGDDGGYDAPAQASVQREVYDADDGGYDAPIDAPAQASVQREVYDDYDEPDGDYDAPVDMPSSAPDTVQRTVDNRASTPAQPNVTNGDFPQSAHDMPSTQDDSDFVGWAQDVPYDDSVDINRDFVDEPVNDRSSRNRRAVISEVNTESYDNLYETHIPSYNNQPANDPVDSGYPDMAQAPSPNADSHQAVQRDFSGDDDGQYDDQFDEDVYDDKPQPAQWVEPTYDNSVQNNISDAPSDNNAQRQMVQRDHDIVSTPSQSNQNPAGRERTGRNNPVNDDVEIVFPADHVQRVMDDNDGDMNQVDLFTALQQVGVVPPSGDNHTERVQRQVEQPQTRQNTPAPPANEPDYTSNMHSIDLAQALSSQNDNVVSRAVVDDVSASIGDEGEGEAGDGQPDIDKIARDVYNRLKDRLRIERERRHSK